MKKHNDTFWKIALKRKRKEGDIADQMWERKWRAETVGVLIYRIYNEQQPGSNCPASQRLCMHKGAHLRTHGHTASRSRHLLGDICKPSVLQGLSGPQELPKGPCSQIEENPVNCSQSECREMCCSV